VGNGSQGGSVAINSNSLWVDYIPTTAFTGTETFTYTARDSGGLEDTATVTVTVVNGDGGGSTDPGDGVDQTITIPNTGGSGTITITITLPGGGSNTLSLLYNEQPTPGGAVPQGYVSAGLSFNLDAYLNQQLQAGYVFSRPITITLTYSDSDVAGLPQGEDSLELRRWDGSRWVSAGITVTNRAPASNQLTVIVDRAGEYALLGGDMTFTYLPLVVSGYTTAPDLVITDLSAGGDSITVKLENQGNAAVTDDFWVDVYFNPTETPALNQPWQNIAPAGATWGVTADIPAGDSLTLTVGDAYYATQYSSSSFPTGAQVYGYVDSVSYASSTGAVYESNEGNNLFGPVTSGTGSGAVPLNSQGDGPDLAGLPQR
jgi:hypothetical protein